DDSMLNSVEIEFQFSAARAVPPTRSAPVNVAAGDELKPGLVTEVFIIPDGPSDLDDAWFTTTPLFRRIDRQISYSKSDSRFGDTGLKDSFAVSWSGILRVPETGDYEIAIYSDDGVRVSLDGQTILADEAPHWPRSATKHVQLTSGDHELLV